MVESTGALLPLGDNASNETVYHEKLFTGWITKDVSFWEEKLNFK